MSSEYENCPIDFSSQPYWPAREKIEYLQRRVIVASIAYYELDESYLEDKAFDDLAHQLVWYQKEYKEEAESSRYWYLMSDFDGSTGFDLYKRLNRYDRHYLERIAQMVIKSYKERNK